MSTPPIPPTATDAASDELAGDPEPVRTVIVGGDGYGSHDDCDPDDAVADLSGPDGADCWICGEELAA